MSAPAQIGFDPASRGRGSARLWILAAIGAIALHASAVALAISYAHSNDDDEALGSPALEIALDLEAPHLDPTNLPPGPQAEDSTASPELAEQQEKVEETDLPKDTPTETDDADRLVSPQPNEKKLRRRSDAANGCNSSLDGIGRQ